MAVAFDAKMTTGNGTGGTYEEVNGLAAISSTGMTVGAGATLLVVLIVWHVAVTSPSATWNGVAMTLGPTISNTVRTAIFYLVNPTSGNKTLSASWTTSSATYMSAISFTGTDTTTGIKTSDSTTASDVASITVTSDASGGSVAAYTNDTAQTGTPNFNVIFSATDLAHNGYGNYQLGGTSNVHTFAGATPHTALAGVHVIPPSGGGAVIFQELAPAPAAGPQAGNSVSY
jgi:hypothetical protein